MTLAPQVRPYATAPFVGPHSVHGYYGELMDNSTQAVSATWTAAQRVVYYPVVIPTACVAYRLFWLNGATVGTDTVQVGIYNDNDAGDDGPGNAIVRGTATTSAGANVCQFDNIADTVIPSGRIWLAMWASGITTTMFRHAPNGSLARNMCGYIEASASGLPATATPVSSSSPYVPVFGFTTIAAP